MTNDTSYALLCEAEALLQDIYDLLEIEDPPGALDLMDEIDALLSKIEDLI